MGMYNFTVENGSLRADVLVTGGDFSEQGRSYKTPSVSLIESKLKLAENGIHKQTFLFTMINEIDGVAPTDIVDANEKLLALIGTL